MSNHSSCQRIMGRIYTPLTNYSKSIRYSKLMITSSTCPSSNIDTLVICLIQNDKICRILSSSWNKTLAITKKKFKMFKMPPMCSRNPNILWTKNFRLEPKKFKKSKSINLKSKLTDNALEYWYLKKMFVTFMLINETTSGWHLLVIFRYESLSEPATIRRDNLEDALLMYQYYRDVEDELSWIQEKLPIASSTDLGNSLNAVQNLMKKHQVTNWSILRLPVFANFIYLYQKI